MAKPERRLNEERRRELRERLNAIFHPKEPDADELEVFFGERAAGDLWLDLTARFPSVNGRLDQLRKARDPEVANLPPVMWTGAGFIIALLISASSAGLSTHTSGGGWGGGGAGGGAGGRASRPASTFASS